MLCRRVFQQKLSRLGSLGIVLSALHILPPAKLGSLGMSLTNTLVDYSLCLALSAYSMTAAVGHFGLSSSDTTVLDWNNHDH